MEHYHEIPVRHTITKLVDFGARHLLIFALLTCFLLPTATFFEVKAIVRAGQHSNAQVLCRAINGIEGHIHTFVIALSVGSTAAEQKQVLAELKKDFPGLDCKASPITFNK